MYHCDWKWVSLLCAAATMTSLGCDGETTSDTSSNGQGGAAGTGAAGGQGGGGQGGGGQGGGGGAMAIVKAEAIIAPQSGSSVTGTATFVGENGKVTLTLNIAGAVPGERAVHIHEMGDCSMDGMGAMGHWNPDMQNHGKWGVGEFHLGDIGNVTIGADGKGTLTMSTDLWSIGDGSGWFHVVGRALMVHAEADDFVTQPTGNAGARVGCGVITKVP